MKNTPIRIDRHDDIAVITFNRPEQMNSIDNVTLNAFKSGVADIAQDKNLRCLIITGSGTTFCGGADLSNSLSGDDRIHTTQALMDLYRPFININRLQIPVIAAVNGHAIGGGFGLALLCDMRIVSEDARLGANFARLGIHAGMAVSYLLPRLVGVARASELLFTGKLITGRKAMEMGLANEVVTKDQVFNTSIKLAQQIAGNAPAAVRMMKQSMYDHLDWQPYEAAKMEVEKQVKTFETEDSKEGITAFFEKREPVFTGK